MSAYRYPDATEEITGKFIAMHEPFAGYWAASEALALQRAIAFLASRHITQNQTLSVLDIGAGEGRLLSWLRPFAKELVAMEPDTERLAAAKQLQLADTYATNFTQLGDRTFDLILNSHVIQHIPSAEVEILLGQLQAICRPGGFLILLFCRAPIGEGSYNIATVGNDKQVSKQVFDAAAKRQTNGTLPFQLFDPVELKALGTRLGWSPCWEWTFHIVEEATELPLHIGRDNMVNSSPAMAQKYGRDMCMIWQKTYK